MSKCKLTIGMACYDDYDGVYMTVNSLRQYHDLFGCEILVIDNAPDTQGGKDVAELVKQLADSTRYIPFTDSVGPAQSKDAIFANAQGEAVLVVDSHVLLEKYAIARLKQFYSDNPDAMDLYQGPRQMDTLRRYCSATHFRPVWSGGMQGQWSTAWYSPNGELAQSYSDNGKLRLTRMDNDKPVVHPSIDWGGHEEKLIEAGWTLAIDRDELLEIPSQGMGLFTCRKDAWLGFNPLFREFGGEEQYIHDKYRKAGRKCWCVPWLGWQHRDRKSEEVEYPNRNETMFRNYVLGYRELGKPVGDLVTHYSKRLTPDVINRVLQNPEEYTPKQEPKPDSKQAIQPTHRTRLELFNWLLQQPRELNEHGHYLAKVASKCRHVTEISKHRESSVFLLAGNPDHLRSFQEEHDHIIDLQDALLSKEVNNRKSIAWTKTLGPLGEYPKDPLPDIDDTELLFLNSRHSYSRVAAELEKYSMRVSKFIMITNSIAHGKSGENGDQGIGPAVLEFVKANPQWFILRHDIQQGGLTTLSCVQSIRPAEDIVPWERGYGPGTELKKLLSAIGITTHASCKCNERARRMDNEGEEWCEANLPMIVGWLREEYDKQKTKLNITIPFVEVAVKLLVKRAIHNSRKAERS